ncbi:MAG TPA: hypothetical protein VJ732_18480, partial [Bryobacteraceae bacterium]|nr:hypothetical protein [Bryobacteraceae bacterium]
VTVRAAPAPPRVAFRAQQQALEANQGRPLDPEALNTLRSNPGAAAPHVQVRNTPPARAFQNQAPPRNDRPQGAFQPRNERPLEARPAGRPAEAERPRGERPVPAERKQERKGRPEPKEERRENRER